MQDGQLPITAYPQRELNDDKVSPSRIFFVVPPAASSLAFAGIAIAGRTPASRRSAFSVYRADLIRGCRFSALTSAPHFAATCLRNRLPRLTIYSSTTGQARYEQ